MFSDREVLCFLQHIPGIGSKTIQALWGYFKTGDAIYHAEEKALECLLNERQRKAFLHAREKEDISERITKMKAEGIDYYSIFDWNYPKRLRKIADAPMALFVKGSLPPEDTMTASVVGARKHSYYGEKYAKVYSGMLAEAGVSVISGMAKGIDSIAQMAAIEKGGKSYAILGCGVDICYPPECRNLYNRLPLAGGIISEYPPGTAPNAGLFPLRNRIISALGDVLLVMEARQRSGTLITVDMALEQGKEIWALPGRCDDVLSYGCNRLISQGAGILTGEEDFKEELHLLKEKYTQVSGIHLLRREKAAEKAKESVRKKVAEKAEESANKKAAEKAEEFVRKKVAEKAEESANKKAAEKAEEFVRKEMPDNAGKTEQPQSLKMFRLSEMENLVLSVLDYQPLSLNRIYSILQEMGKDVLLPDIGNVLVELCVRGMAKQVNGNFYIKL